MASLASSDCKWVGENVFAAPACRMIGWLVHFVVTIAASQVHMHTMVRREVPRLATSDRSDPLTRTAQVPVGYPGVFCSSMLTPSLVADSSADRTIIMT